MTELERLKKERDELVLMHQLDMAEIIRLRRWIERLEDKHD